MGKRTDREQRLQQEVGEGPKEKEQGFSVCFNYHASSLLVRHIMLHDWCKLGFKINLAKSSISILVLVVWVVNIVRIKGERKYLGSE